MPNYLAVSRVPAVAASGRSRHYQPQRARVRTQLTFVLPKPADLLAGALFLGATLGTPSAVEARLPGGLSKNSDNPYADVMKSKTSGPSAEDLYKQGGGACGPGFELKRTLSVGANCVCVDETVCDLSRGEMSVEERAFGKKKEEPAPENSIVGNDGMVFTFDFEQQ